MVREINTGKRLEDMTIDEFMGDHREKGELPIAFFCRLGVCEQVMVWEKGETVQEARENISEIPTCVHGKMKSAPYTRPL